MLNVLDLSHRQAQRTLATGAPVFLPVNPVEYHGPHLSLRNDAHISAGLIRALHAALQPAHPGWPLLVVDDLEIGVDPVPGPGSRPVSFRQVRSQVAAAANALADLGARRVVLMTFHGSPLHNAALHRAVTTLQARGVRALSPMNALLRELLAIDPEAHRDLVEHIPDPAARERVLADLPADLHGGFLETSLTMHFAPETVSDTVSTLPPCPPLSPSRLLLGLSSRLGALGADELSQALRLAAVGESWFSLRPFPGYTSAPHLASPQAGARLSAKVIERFAALCEAVFDGAPPPGPLMPWLSTVSLHGRLTSPRIPLAQIRVPGRTGAAV